MLVTASWRGTGEATAKAFAAEGAVVFVHGFEAGQADAVAESIVADGGAAVSVAGDIATDAGCESLAERVRREGGADVLVNNYGVAAAGDWPRTTGDDWIDAYRRNVLAGVRMATLLVPAMKDRGWGRVIFLGTVGAVRPRAAMPHYYAAKAALPAVVLSLAKELSGSGITVNAVSPGLLRTAEIEATYRRRAVRKGWGEDWNEIERRALAETIGAGSAATRMGLPSEVAAAVLFLASEQAAYVNAVDLRVDGGAADCVR